ncbi:phosphoenolpyruvate synthase [Fodinibius halophilus]|uniref:Phosphoenolpyruvate synthase n=1 Tax=Fodinibius halophilus TaxID=1736908 RepID=A0A6M1TDN5_9BACT|nr:phosphoenolpyruvate synthase [Fodinibius halophilus]NGP86810.1 phosphoenolpyruvate synthase [Fodinibius halophilus]
MDKSKMILGLSEVSLDMVDKVGGKNASLGEMIGNLADRGINVPDGFVVTVAAYDKYMEANGLTDHIRTLVDQLDVDDLVQLRKTGMQIRQLIMDGNFPDDLKEVIEDRYEELSLNYGKPATDVAVRSSATTEDLPDASFAGQQDSFLNVRGHNNVINSIKACFASLFTDRAISYRTSAGFDHMTAKLSVCIQKMARSDLGASGVSFSIDPESGFDNAVIINGTFGLGELLVQGEISPDEFIVFKPTLAEGKDAIIEKKLGEKTHKLAYGHKPNELTRKLSLEEEQRKQFCLTDEQALQLAKWVVEIEEYYTKRNDRWTPVDVEWAYDGLSEELFIVQARPETVHANQKVGSLTQFNIDDENRHERLIFEGIAVGDRIGKGEVNVIHTLDGRDGSADEADFEDGQVLVTEMTDPDWEPLMKKASAIVTNKGGRTCHAAIVARELGIPAIVGSTVATQTLNNEQEVTVSCAEGSSGKVYEGLIDFKEIDHQISDLPETETPIMLNVASPDMAFKFSKVPNSGVGLAREEFIINNYIHAHPLALLYHEDIGDEELTERINEITYGYDDESEFFIKKLSYGIAHIGAAFHPNRVIVRFSDFKSNEYRNLVGGSYFEPEEENPMIGWRGASRYYSDKYKVAFGLECQAIKRVREVYGLTNITVMIPFCRTPEELQKVLAVMEEYGLKRGENGLEVYLMAELPSNIMMAEEFAEHVDGFSIGSNDLTQLTLGLDRDSSLVAHVYDERNEAVKRMILMLLEKAKKTGTKVGICGQGPSDFPDFAEFLVKNGIDTISVTPDSMFKTLYSISELEKKLVKAE